MSTTAALSLTDRFAEYDRTNPIVWEKFQSFARSIRARGFKTYSAWTLVNVIRWHVDLTTASTDGFKVNNDFISMYARKLVAEDPSFEGFFALRSMTRA